MQIHESSEDYLESILMLKERKGFVRSIDIANELDYTKASVSIAMKKLRENGYIEVDAEGFITLTPAGHKIAARIYGRHKLLTEFFVRLGVSQETAAFSAPCRNIAPIFLICAKFPLNHSYLSGILKTVSIC